MTRPLAVNEAIDERGEVVVGQEHLFGYHGTRSKLEDVLHDGLPAGGTNRNLKDHVLGHPDSAFRGMSPIPGRGGSRSFRAPVEILRRVEVKYIVRIARVTTTCRGQEVTADWRNL